MIGGSTLAVHRQAVKDLGYEAASSVIDGAIRAALRRSLSSKRWPFLETQSASLVTTPGVNTVTLSTTDLLHVHAVRLDFVTETVEISYLELEDLRDRYQRDRVTDTPLIWSQAGDMIVLYPAPSKAYQITLDYSKYPTPPVADGDVLPWPSPHDNVILWGAASLLSFRQRDWAGKSAADMDYQLQLGEMRQAYNIRQRQTSSQVASSSYWDRLA